MVKKSFRAALFGAMVGLSYIVPVTAGSADDTPIPMPNILLADGSGLSFPLSRYLGNVLVIEFWSTGCAPCINDLNFLNHLQGDFPGKPLMVLAVSEDTAGIGAVKAAMARQKLGFLHPFADPNGNAAQVLNLRGLPTSFVVDRHGQIVMQLEGPQQWNSAAYEKRINVLVYQPFP